MLVIRMGPVCSVLMPRSVVVIKTDAGVFGVSEVEAGHRHAPALRAVIAKQFRAPAHSKILVEVLPDGFFALEDGPVRRPDASGVPISVEVDDLRRRSAA